MQLHANGGRKENESVFGDALDEGNRESYRCSKMEGLVSCVRSAGLVARVTRRLPLLYSGGADAAQDRPAHVRACSSVRVLRPGLLGLVQDDANFVALVNLESLAVTAIALPEGKDGKRLFDVTRGTKKEKMDMEASVVDDEGRLVLFGSGSSAKRERLAFVDASGKSGVEVFDAKDLYAALRQTTRFAGSDLNIEGAARVGDTTLRLFNRNNGEAKGGLVPVNASCDLSWREFVDYTRGRGAAPAPQKVVQYNLGSLENVSLGFTDADCVDGTVYFCGAAEDSPNAILDGPVTGSVIGRFLADGSGEWIEVRTSDGKVFGEKIEGLVVLPGAQHAYAVVDRDSPDVPSELIWLDLKF